MTAPAVAAARSRVGAAGRAVSAVRRRSIRSSAVGIAALRRGVGAAVCRCAAAIRWRAGSCPSGTIRVIGACSGVRFAAGPAVVAEALRCTAAVGLVALRRPVAPGISGAIAGRAWRTQALGTGGSHGHVRSSCAGGRACHDRATLHRGGWPCDIGARIRGTKSASVRRREANMIRDLCAS